MNIEKLFDILSKIILKEKILVTLSYTTMT